VKNDNAGRMTARTIEELKGGISKAIDRLRALPELICGFFKVLTSLTSRGQQASPLTKFPVVASVDRMAVATRRRMPRAGVG
jgi:hypothetical protein